MKKDDVRKILEATALEPCHVTGMHDPRHTPRYVCMFQKADAFDRLMIFLRRKPFRRTHKNGCCWCGGNERKVLIRWALYSPSK